MSFALHYDDEIKDKAVVSELQDFYAFMKGFLLRNFNEDGTINWALATGTQNPSIGAAPVTNLNNVNSPQFVNFVAQIAAAMNRNPGGVIPSGSGTGDVVGPAGAGDGNVALYDGVTGKLIKDGGTIAALTTNILAGQSVFTAEYFFSIADFHNYNTTPLLLIPGVGGKTIIVLDGVFAQVLTTNFSGINGMSGGFNVKTQYADGTLSGAHTNQFITDNAVRAVPSYSVQKGVGVSFSTTKTPVGRPVYIEGVADAAPSTPEAAFTLLKLVVHYSLI